MRAEKAETRGPPWGSVVKNPPAKAEDLGSIPGSGRSPGGGNGDPPQYSCLENPMDRGAWRATVHGSQKIGHDLVPEQQQETGKQPDFAEPDVMVASTLFWKVLHRRVA